MCFIVFVFFNNEGKMFVFFWSIQFCWWFLAHEKLTGKVDTVYTLAKRKCCSFTFRSYWTFSDGWNHDLSAIRPNNINIRKIVCSFKTAFQKRAWHSQFSFCCCCCFVMFLCFPLNVSPPLTTCQVQFFVSIFGSSSFMRPLVFLCVVGSWHCWAVSVWAMISFNSFCTLTITQGFKKRVFFF